MSVDAAIVTRAVEDALADLQCAHAGSPDSVDYLIAAARYAEMARLGALPFDEYVAVRNMQLEHGSVDLLSFVVVYKQQGWEVDDMVGLLTMCIGALAETPSLEFADFLQKASLPAITTPYEPATASFCRTPVREDDEHLHDAIAAYSSAIAAEPAPVVTKQRKKQAPAARPADFPGPGILQSDPPFEIETVEAPPATARIAVTKKRTAKGTGLLGKKVKYYDGARHVVGVVTAQTATHVTVTEETGEVRANIAIDRVKTSKTKKVEAVAAAPQREDFKPDLVIQVPPKKAARMQGYLDAGKIVEDVDAKSAIYETRAAQEDYEIAIGVYNGDPSEPDVAGPFALCGVTQGTDDAAEIVFSGIPTMQFLGKHLVTIGTVQIVVGVIARPVAA